MLKDNFSRRTVLLKKEIDRSGLDALIITKAVNISYLSGFSGHDAIAIVTHAKNYLLTDSRYIEEARCASCGFEVRLMKGSALPDIARIMADCKIKSAGFESCSMPYSVVMKLKRGLPGIKLKPTGGLIEEIRSVKDKDEVTLISSSVSLAKKILAEASRMIMPGISEKRIASGIEIGYISRGAKAAFDPIVSFGSNTSKPHASASHRRLKSGDVIMIDSGCVLDGYCSDITIMASMVGFKGRFGRIYDIVRKAQEIAINAVRPGVRISDIDDAARGYISDEGYGKFFGHALGHGVGMEIHEKPSISASSEDRLKEGMVFTVEPAIYIPGFGGVRIEDMVLVTEKGFRVLTI